MRSARQYLAGLDARSLDFLERMVGVRAEVKKVYDLYVAGGIGVEQF